MFGDQGVSRVPLFHAHASFGEVHCVACCTDARWPSPSRLCCQPCKEATAISTYVLSCGRGERRARTGAGKLTCEPWRPPGGGEAVPMWGAETVNVAQDRELMLRREPRGGEWAQCRRPGLRGWNSWACAGTGHVCFQSGLWLLCFRLPLPSLCAPCLPPRSH